MSKDEHDEILKAKFDEIRMLVRMAEGNSGKTKEWAEARLKEIRMEFLLGIYDRD